MGECAACGRSGANRRCSRCKSVSYCDVECQSKHWLHSHKFRCSSVASEAQRIEKLVGDGRDLKVAHRDVLTEKLRQGNVVFKEVVGGSGVGTMKSRRRRRAPKPDLFPPQLRDFSYKESADGIDENLLLLLHGLGDTHKKFSSLAEQMELPQTATLAVSGPIVFPEELVDDGRAWFTAFDENWNLIQPTETETRRILSLKETSKLMNLLMDALTSHCGWTRDRIHLLGFSQGGTVALDMALRACGPYRLGSVVAISSSLLPESFLQSTEENDVTCEQNACTSVLMTHGNQDKVVNRTDVLRSADWLRKAHASMDVQLRTLDKDHAMVSSRREMQILMEFWAKHLHCHMVNLEQNATVYEVSHSQ